jgi:hypothetical protein
LNTLKKIADKKKGKVQFEHRMEFCSREEKEAKKSFVKTEKQFFRRKKLGRKLHPSKFSLLLHGTDKNCVLNKRKEPFNMG